MKVKGIDRQDFINLILQNNKEIKILLFVIIYNFRNLNIVLVVNYFNGVFKIDEDMVCVLIKFKFINSKR